MHVFSVAQRVYDPLFDRFFEPGAEYLIESQNVPSAPGQPFRYPTVKLEPMRWEDYGFKTVPSYREGETIVFIRAGGYGDLFYLLPVIAAAERRCSRKANLFLVTAMKPFPTNLRVKFMSFPCAVSDLPANSVVLNMEDLPGEMERDAAGSTTIRYARRAGIDAEELVFDAAELFPFKELKRHGDELWERWHGKRRPRIFVALTASAATRSFPFALQFAAAFAANAALFVATKTPFVTPFPCGELSSAFDWMAAVCAADGVVGVDTAPTHLAILLKKPTLAVFGAIPASLRVPEPLQNSPNLTVLEVANTETCPCRLNRPACPVSQQPFCFALAAMQQRVFEAMREFIVQLS